MARKTFIGEFKYFYSPRYAKWIKKAMTHRFNVLESSVRTGKDYNAAIAFIERIKISEGTIHLIAGTSLSRAYQIVGQYIINYCGGLATKSYYGQSDCIRFRYKDKEHIILMLGGRNKGSDELIKGLTIQNVYLTEANLLDHLFVAETLNRTGASKNPALFFTINPKGKRHWFYTEFLDIWQKENKLYRNYLNFFNPQFEDNPILTKQMIQQMKAGKDPNTVWYKRDILGQRVDAEGNLYEIKPTNILETFNPSDYLRWSAVLDIGENNSATAFLIGAIYFNRTTNQRELHILKEYHHLNAKQNDWNKKKPEDYIKDYVLFILEGIELFNRQPEYILYDGSTQLKRDIQQELNRNRLGQHTPKYVDKKIDPTNGEPNSEKRIYALRSALYHNKLRIDKECTITIEDLENAEVDQEHYDRTGNIRINKEYDQLGHKEMVDLTDYLIAQYDSLIGGLN